MFCVFSGTFKNFWELNEKVCFTGILHTLVIFLVGKPPVIFGTTNIFNVRFERACTYDCECCVRKQILFV